MGADDIANETTKTKLSMKTKNLTSRIILFFGFCLCFFLFSCEKEYKPNKESEHTINVNIRGSLNVIPSGEKLNDVPIEVIFKQPWSNLKVASGKTKNGEFNFNVKIDTITFRDYSLVISFTEPTDYIAPKNGDEKRFFNYDEDGLKSINFGLYKKTTLTVNLNRTQIDDFRSLYIHRSFENNRDMYLYLFSASELKSGKTVQIETAADVYTYVIWEKSFNDGGRQLYFDSLVCKPNTNNIFNA